MKVWDLEKKEIYKKNNLQNNLHTLFKKYGSNFYIKYKDIKLFVHLYYDTLQYRDNQKVYFLEYYVKYFSDRLKPFKIKFMDLLNKKINNNAEIFWIGKIDKDKYNEVNRNISGSEIVNITIEICKKLGVKDLYIRDNVMIECDKNKEQILLSPFKLIEKRQTYYMKFGFRAILTDDHKKYYKNINMLNKEVKKHINRIKRYKIKDFIFYYKKVINIILKNKKISEFYLLKNKPYIKNKKYFSYTIVKNKDDYLKKYRDIYKMLLQEKKKSISLYKWLKEVFIKKCDIYNLFFNFINNDIYGFSVKNKIIKNPFYELFIPFIIYKDCYFIKRL